jgi:chlorophyllide a oxygenase
MVFSTIGLQQPGRIERGARAADCRNHLHQMHVCLPARQGHTRLLYRMSLDFMGWSKFVPGIQRFWESIAGQVLGEDLVLVKGQQDRLLRGGDTWAHPVSYDKLGVRYRRWRNAMAHGNALNGQAQSQSGVGSGLARPFSMDAGQLFSVDEEDEDGEDST